MINKSLILMNFSDELYYKCSVWNKADDTAEKLVIARLAPYRGTINF